MDHGTKAITPAQVKAGPEDGLKEGEALAMISLYGLKDADGDRVKPGAFTDFAEAMKADGTLPMVWQHGRDPFDYIGEVLELDPQAKDDEGRDGLAVKVAFDIESDIPEGRSRARQAYKNVKGRRVTQWSYAWEGEATKLEDGTRELDKMRLSEVSPVLRGALSQTRTLAVKEQGLAEPWASLATDDQVKAWLDAASEEEVGQLVAVVTKHVTTPARDAQHDPQVSLARVALDLPQVLG